MATRTVRGPSGGGEIMSDLTDLVRIRGIGGKGPSLGCSEFSGVTCDYVQEADQGDAAVGYHVNQIMALLNKHMGIKHQVGLDASDRAEIRARFANAG